MSDLRLFLREFLRDYRVTGAVAPSSRFLARALARFVPPTIGYVGTRRILEVGTGTGAVTRGIMKVLAAQDTLDLVELNDRFVARLRERLAFEQGFRAAATRTRVLHQDVEELPSNLYYDVIVSGLPLNNFPVAQASRILTALTARLAPGGVLSFFEYVWARPLKALVSGREERQRIRGIAQAYRGLIEPYGFRRELVLLNVPPAWVQHIRLDA